MGVSCPYLEESLGYHIYFLKLYIFLSLPAGDEEQLNPDDIMDINVKVNKNMFFCIFDASFPLFPSILNLLNWLNETTDSQ